MEVMYERCAGRDIHKKMVQVCCITLDARGQRHKEQRQFATKTQDLLGPLLGIATTEAASGDNGYDGVADGEVVDTRTDGARRIQRAALGYKRQALRLEHLSAAHCSR